jgi:hypothetical protein
VFWSILAPKLLFDLGQIVFNGQVGLPSIVFVPKSIGILGLA